MTQTTHSDNTCLKYTSAIPPHAILMQWPRPAIQIQGCSRALQVNLQKSQCHDNFLLYWVHTHTELWKMQRFLLCAEGVSKVQQQMREKQQQAAVQLKHHIDKAQAELAQKAEVHQTRAKQRAEMHAKSFNSLLDSGQNPYAVSMALVSPCSECTL